VLRALHLTKSYDGAPLFDGLSLTLNPGDRAGLVGPNGAGKSTLLRLLAGREQADSGSLFATATVGYLPQEAPGGDGTLDDLVHAALGEAGEALRALQQPGDLDAYTSALETAEATGAWAAEARAEEVRRRLGIDHLAADRPLSALSGGEQARALLAAALLEDPDVLLLDEPTNHLDADGLRWLEEFLAGFPGAVLVVSHDRRFLDAVVTRIYELSDGLEHFDGGYTEYRDEKARRRERLEELATAQDKRRRRLEADISATAGYAQYTERTVSRAAAPKLKRYAKKVAKKAKSREHRLEREMASTNWVERPREAPAVRLKLDAAADKGRRVAHLQQASLRTLTDVDLTLHGGERVAVTGPNGAGKTTLLELLLQTTPTARLLPQWFNATGPVLPWFRAHTRQGIDESEARTLLAHFGIGAEAILRPLEPRPARPRGDRRARRQRGRPAAARRADQPPRLRHARGPGDRARQDPEHDRRRLPRPLVPRRDRHHAAPAHRGRDALRGQQHVLARVVADRVEEALGVQPLAQVAVRDHDALAVVERPLDHLAA
jgi:ATPase subunit of ABC transporter with duplicated ATPase domains